MIISLALDWIEVNKEILFTPLNHLLCLSLSNSKRISSDIDSFFPHRSVRLKMIKSAHATSVEDEQQTHPSNVWRKKSFGSGITNRLELWNAITISPPSEWNSLNRSISFHFDDEQILSFVSLFESSRAREMILRQENRSILVIRRRFLFRNGWREEEFPITMQIEDWSRIKDLHRWNESLKERLIDSSEKRTNLSHEVNEVWHQLWPVDFISHENLRHSF